MEYHDEYRRALTINVCARCIDAGAAGGCRLPAGQQCALAVHAAPLIEAVLSVTSSSIVPYQAAVRQRVCAVCANRSADARCAVRNELECALDRYLPLVVDAIEETQAAACAR